MIKTYFLNSQKLPLVVQAKANANLQMRNCFAAANLTAGSRTTF